MTSRIFRAVFYACLSVLLVAVAGAAFVSYHGFSQEQTIQLQDQARILARVMDADPSLSPDDLDTGQMRVTLVDPEGTVLFDSRFDPAQMSSHSDREEIREAMENGTGFAIRRSDSLSEDTYNAAIRLDNGKILRICRTHASLLSVFISSLMPMTLVFAAAAVLSWILARRASRDIVEPINAIDPAHPLDFIPYEQLLPLQQKLEDNRREISDQMESLQQSRREFSILASHMEEGLLMAADDGKILSVNSAARRLFGLKRKEHLDQNQLLSSLMEKTRTQMQARTILQHDQETWLVQASRIQDEGGPGGLLVLALDITEKEEAATRRKEFTANVTHQLKTPLQTILSSSELIENGMIQPADLPVFAGYINKEAKRMSVMINDIIHLSRLDNDLPSEKTILSLAPIVRLESDKLASPARLKEITVTADLEPASVLAAESDLADIVSNLLDNAIRCSSTDSSIEIGLKSDSQSVILTIQDHGPGMSEAVSRRIFERFYTYDPDGKHVGSGLGLAIVRHAVERNDGTITVKSAPGEGTLFTVTFPKTETES